MQKLNYIDPKTKEYVTLDCALKEESQLKSFYGKIYGAKLDKQFDEQKLLGKNYHSGNLIQVFKEIVENDVLDATNLLDCIMKNDGCVSKQAAMVSTSFFDLFDYQKEMRMTNEEYEVYHYFCSSHGTFGSDTLKVLKSEKDRYENNSKLLNLLSYTPREEKTEEKAKQKIIQFNQKEKNRTTKQA